MAHGSAVRNGRVHVTLYARKVTINCPGWAEKETGFQQSDQDWLSDLSEEKEEV